MSTISEPLAVPLSERMSLWEKVHARLRGLPRTWRELDRSLALLALLRQLGWQATANRGRPVDGRGQPVPWWTHGVADWLAPSLRPTDRVFEWGSGHSTLWLAAHVGTVVSVEDVAPFAASLRQRAPANVDILVRVDESYATAITEHPHHFDVIVIDGQVRPTCAALAPAHLTREGLILYDNSDRPDATVPLQNLAAAGFYRVDFCGLVSGSHHFNATSALFRNPERWLRGPAPEWFGY